MDRLRFSSRRFRLVWRALALTAAISAVASPLSAADAPFGAGAPAVLVLRNGNVLAGGVTKLAGYYQIDLEGATFRVPLGQVEIACGTLDEAYEIRRSQRAGWSADSHVELAGWCLRNNLPDQAAREILDVRSMDPRNPAIGPLETQLKQAFLESSRRQAKEAKRSQQPVAKTPGVRESRISAARDMRHLAASVALDIGVAEQAQFVRHIQPMLIHSCAIGGCHQATAKEPMRLDRWALDGGGSPDIVRRNLAEVLAQVDVEHPDASPLIEHGRVAHGRDRSRRPSRPLDARQHAILKFWIDEVCGATYQEPLALTSGRPFNSADAADSSREGDEAARGEIAPCHKPSAVRQGADALPASVLHDEFDPTLFNSPQYASPSQTSSE